MTRFSIIIPVYNVSQYLRECLDSLRAQSFGNWEAICVDDGSTDSSGKILDAYAENDGRIRVYHKKNEGVSAARNVAISFACGEYIGFLDADDRIATSWLATVDSIASQSSPDLVRLSITAIKDGEPLPLVRAACCKECVWGSHDTLVWGWRIFSRQGWSVVNFVRREIALASEFPIDQKMQEDTVYFLGIVDKIRSIVHVDYAGYFYRERMGSASSSRYRAEDCLVAMKRILGIFNRHERMGLCSHSELRQYFVNCLVSILSNWIRTHDAVTAQLRHLIHRVLVDNVSFCDVIRSRVPFKAKIRSLIFYCHERLLI